MKTASASRQHTLEHGDKHTRIFEWHKTNVDKHTQKTQISSLVDTCKC